MKIVISHDNVRALTDNAPDREFRSFYTYN